MNKCRCNQDSCSKVLGAEQERGGYAQTWKLDDKNRKGTSSRRHEQNDEQPAHMEGQVIVGLRAA